MARVYIGTSGWQYSHWKGIFYPAYLSYKDWLKFYSKYFKTVEVNSSFYGQTKASTFEKWKLEVPPNFVFSIKANRYITHVKKLKGCQEAVKVFFDSANTLLTNRQTKVSVCDVILWQFPPSLKKDIKRLRSFLELLPKTFRHAFEFRHPSWVDKDTLISLIQSRLETTVVFQDWKDWPSFEDYTRLIEPEQLSKLPFIYLRFHGREQLYISCYSDEELANWGKSMQKWKSIGVDVYAYFNNDALGYAVDNALRLINLIQSG